MFSPEIVLLGFALAIDAAIVSFALGLLGKEGTFAQHLHRGILACLTFGFFQFLMLWLGSYGGYILSFSAYGYLFQIVVSFIFFMIATKLIKDSFEDKLPDVKPGFISLAVLAIVTSIDALGAGFSLGTLPQTYLIASEVGVITALVCGIFYTCSQYIPSIPTKWMFRLASLAFFVLCGKSLIHLL
jgi:putative Mn2+ efflux pump MntP